ncbi:MAG TPA: cellulase family glycosylhydrolase [Mesorhizobium sp.]
MTRQQSPAARSTLTRRQAVGGVAALLAAPLLPSPGMADAAPVVPTRGFNLPGWVDREDGTAPAKATLEKLRGLGFETIRLPVAADPLLSGASAQATMLGRIDAAIGEALAGGFAVIVDLHPGEKFAAALRNDPAQGGKQAVAAWDALAGVVAGQPAGKVYAELLNEPPMQPAAWLELRDRLAETVRAKCPRHTIIWGTAPVQGMWELADAPLLADDNAIVAVHYYTPMGFTHQCENWDGSPLGRLANLPFPATKDGPQAASLFRKFKETGDTDATALLNQEFTGPWTVEHIASDFARLGEWSRNNRCPAIVDEFGVLDFCVDAPSRGNWVRAVRQAAEANGIGWAYWELDQGFGFIKDRTSTEGFDSAMIDALVKG